MSASHARSSWLKRRRCRHSRISVPTFGWGRVACMRRTIADTGRRNHDLGGYRRCIGADATISAAAGVVMTLGAGLLNGVLALPVSLLMAAGLALFPWAACLLWLTRKAVVPRAAVWAVIVCNLAWVADSVWVSLGGSFAPSGLGHAFIALQAATVLLLADLEFVGLRRSRVAMA